MAAAALSDMLEGKSLDEVRDSWGRVVAGLHPPGKGTLQQLQADTAGPHPTPLFSST